MLGDGKCGGFGYGLLSVGAGVVLRGVVAGVLFESGSACASCSGSEGGCTGVVVIACGDGAATGPVFACFTVLLDAVVCNLPVLVVAK